MEAWRYAGTGMKGELKKKVDKRNMEGRRNPEGMEEEYYIRV